MSRPWPRSARSATRTASPPSSLRLADKPQIRRRAVVALAAFESPESDAALRGCLTDPDWQVRQAAEDVLGVIADGRLSGSSRGASWPCTAAAPEMAHRSGSSTR